MGGAVFHRLLRFHTLQQSVYQPAGEAVATPNPIQNLQLGVFAAFVKAPLQPTNSAPVVFSSGFSSSHGTGDTLEVGKGLDRCFNHFPKCGYIQLQQIFIGAFKLQSQASTEVLFVAQHDIHMSCYLLIDLTRAGLPTDALP